MQKSFNSVSDMQIPQAVPVFSVDKSIDWLAWNLWKWRLLVWKPLWHTSSTADLYDWYEQIVHAILSTCVIDVVTLVLIPSSLHPRKCCSSLRARLCQWTIWFPNIWIKAHALIKQWPVIIPIASARLLSSPITTLVLAICNLGNISFIFQPTRITFMLLCFYIL